MECVSLESAKVWHECMFLTCSVLPVNRACNLTCPFCFSRSSISALDRERVDWRSLDVRRYFEFSRERGATRLVVTGGGEPMLCANDVIYLVKVGREYFDEVACFTNGTFLTRDRATQLSDAGLSYLCYSRHHHDDDRCKQIMGDQAPTLDDFFDAAEGLTIRATCVMTQGFVDNSACVQDYISRLSEYGVRQFTFKHTYVAYPQSVFGDSQENGWAVRHQVEFDPFGGVGETIGELPWGPQIKRLGNHQVCYYFEPQPEWEKEHRLCRSVNLLASGEVFASLEDASSRLFRLSN